MSRVDYLSFHTFNLHNIAIGGDYVIPLVGHCLEPRPQGPFTIKPGGNITIPFKNIFHQARQFNFSVDNAAFSVKSGDNIKPRRTYNIVVQFDGKQADTNIAKLGKLVISALSTSGRSKDIKWTYYLKGLPLDSR